MTSRGGSRLAPLLGVAQAMVILCLRSIFHIACKCGTGGILVYSFFGIAESFPGFSMAIIFDCLHILGILFSMKHVLSIVCNHLCALGPRFFSCSTSMSSMPAALLFLSADIPFLYSSSLNADTTDGFPSTVGSAGHLGFVGIVPWPLTSRWCATWLELTRHGGFGEVGLLDSF